AAAKTGEKHFPTSAAADKSNEKIVHARARDGQIRAPGPRAPLPVNGLRAAAIQAAGNFVTNRGPPAAAPELPRHCVAPPPAHDERGPTEAATGGHREAKRAPEPRSAPRPRL